jgi:hypothetical protein
MTQLVSPSLSEQETEAEAQQTAKRILSHPYPFILQFISLLTFLNNFFTFSFLLCA